MEDFCCSWPVVAAVLLLLLGVRVKVIHAPRPRAAIPPPVHEAEAREREWEARFRLAAEELRRAAFDRRERTAELRRINHGHVFSERRVCIRCGMSEREYHATYCGDEYHDRRPVCPLANKGET